MKLVIMNETGHTELEVTHMELVEQITDHPTHWVFADGEMVSREDVNTIFLALQKQNFVLANSITNLINKWPKPPILEDHNITEGVTSKSGILLEIKNSTSTSET